MATFTLKSREFGRQTFYVPDTGGPVRLEQAAAPASSAAKSAKAAA